MYLLLFDIFTVLLIAVDTRNYGKQITPLTIFGGVLTLLINIDNVIISNVYGFYSVNSSTIWTIFGFFVLIFVIDLIGGYLFRNTHHCDFTFSVRFKSYNTVRLLFLMGVMAYGLQFVLLYRAYGLNFKGMNDGILGHLTSLAYILGPVALDLAIKTHKKRRINLTVFLNLVVLGIGVAFGGKYGIFINLTYFSLYFVLKRDRKVNLSKLIKIVFPLVLAAVGVFIVLYYVLPRVTGAYQSTMDFAIRHMFDYLLGPVIANNYTIGHPGQGEILVPFTVLINIGKALIGDHNYVGSIYPFIFPVSNLNMTNVSGFLGETVYNLGIIGALCYTAVIFGIINFFYYQYRSKNKFYLSFCYSNAILAFLFFGNFYTVSGVFLPLLLAIALDVISMCKFGNYHI